MDIKIHFHMKGEHVLLQLKDYVVLIMAGLSFFHLKSLIIDKKINLFVMGLIGICVMVFLSLQFNELIPR